MTRLFVAAWPPTEVCVALSRLVQPEHPDMRWVPAGNWHVTLRFLGDADVADVGRSLDGAVLPETEIRLGPGVERLGPRRIVVPAAGADDLARAVRTATASVGEPDHRRFRGHLTIARTTPGARSAPVGTPFGARFTVHEIAVVRSDLHPDGARYTTVATFATSPPS